MAIRVPQPVRTVAGAALGHAALVYQQAEDFTVAHPERVLHAGLAYAAGTATIGEGGYHSSPPNAPIEVKRRMMIGGAALPDS